MFTESAELAGLVPLVWHTLSSVSRMRNMLQSLSNSWKVLVSVCPANSVTWPHVVVEWGEQDVSGAQALVGVMEVVAVVVSVLLKVDGMGEEVVGECHHPRIGPVAVIGE